jgi:hypothetical protein
MINMIRVMHHSEINVEQDECMALGLFLEKLIV